MFRLIACVPFVALTAFAAAPVPRDAPAPFGTDGLVSHAELEKVAFNSHVVLDRDGKPQDDDEPAVKLDKGGKHLRPNRYDVAVHMPRTKFAAGEPIPAYFVLRNNRDELLGLHSSLDLSGSFPHMHGSGISLDVRERKSGRSTMQGSIASTNCGGGSLIDVPANGFYCMRGDLNRLSVGLEPGEYEVDWRCGRFRSSAVTFIVLPAEAKPAARRESSWKLHFYHLNPGPDDQQLRWPNAHLEHARRDAMVAALAVGRAGPHVPDVRMIPSRDSQIEAQLQWKPHRDADRVSITLHAADSRVPVRFRDVPRLFLQVETPGEDHDQHEAMREALKETQDGRRDLVTPLTLEAKLPDGWREWFGDATRARVSVLVASKEIEFPRGRGERLEKQAERVERPSKRDPSPIWAGVVRTAPVELPLSPPLRGNLK